MKLYTAETIEYSTTETEELYEERDIVFNFSVPYEWAEKWCEQNGYNSIGEFDSSYIWEDSWYMYCAACKERVVVNRVELENEAVYTEYR